MSKSKKKKYDPSHVPVLKEKVLPDPKILEMTREEAMAYFDLPVWAKTEDLDDRFWKLGKTYRAQKDEQKLADIAAAYNIANGTRDREEQERKEEETAKHYFGKTKKQWAEFWHYEWWKFVIAIAVVVLGFAVVEYFFLSPKSDVRMASIGHFELDPDIWEELFEQYSSFKHPDINYANVVSENDEGAQVDVYTMEQAVALLSVRPTILAFDMVSVPGYIYSGTLLPLDDMYDQMKQTYTEKELSYFEPFYYSKAQFYEQYKDDILLYEPELPEVTEEDKQEHIYGFVIRDEILQRALGYTIEWKDNDKGILFGINAGADTIEEGKDFLLKLFQKMEDRRKDYLELYPYIESND